MAPPQPPEGRRDSIDGIDRKRLLLGPTLCFVGKGIPEIMLLQALRQAVLDANLELVRRGLVLYTFGNASGISRQDGLVAIKPSGVPYEIMSAEDIVVTDMSGRVVEGKLRPSSDLATHLEIYKHLPSSGGVAHTHSEFATAWAQAQPIGIRQIRNPRMITLFLFSGAAAAAIFALLARKAR